MFCKFTGTKSQGFQPVIIRADHITAIQAINETDQDKKNILKYTLIVSRVGAFHVNETAIECENIVMNKLREIKFEGIK